MSLFQAFDVLSRKHYFTRCSILYLFILIVTVSIIIINIIIIIIIINIMTPAWRKIWHGNPTVTK